MIFEVKFNDNIPMIEIINLISNIGTFCLSDRVFFINTENNGIEIFSSLQEKISLIKEINNTNYNNIQSDTVKEWCEKQFTSEELQRFEKSPVCQERLEAIMGYLDLVELSTNKKGGNIIGNKTIKPKTRRKVDNDIKTTSSREEITTDELNKTS